MDSLSDAAIREKGEKNADRVGRFKSPESRARSLANLRPWTHAAGARPHPRGGRPKKSVFERELERALAERVPNDPGHRSFFRLICQQLARRAAKGDVRAIAIVLERTLGKVREVAELDMPQQIIVNVNKNVNRFSHVSSDLPDDPV